MFYVFISSNYFNFCIMLNQLGLKDGFSEK